METSGRSPRAFTISLLMSSTDLAATLMAPLAPSWTALSSLLSTISVMTTLLAPMAWAVRRQTRPMGPAPQISTVCPRLRWDLRQAWTPTESGSRRAPSSKDTWSGNLKQKSAGCV
uniref:Uncharacterized protein n=1 Tax=Ixodes ricinus TaxID=34613 RepID=A0A6B0ULM9_IXORI